MEEKESEDVLFVEVCGISVFWHSSSSFGSSLQGERFPSLPPTNTKLGTFV